MKINEFMAKINVQDGYEPVLNDDGDWAGSNHDASVISGSSIVVVLPVRKVELKGEAYLDTLKVGTVFEWNGKEAHTISNRNGQVYIYPQTDDSMYATKKEEGGWFGLGDLREYFNRDIREITADEVTIRYEPK